VHTAIPPDPHPRAPRHPTPPGAVDAHLHLFGPAQRYPFAAETKYVTPDALAESCIEMHRAIDISHGVIVSGGAYGTDSPHLLDMLAAHPGHFRGVTVPPPDLPAAQIEHMTALGVRGVRFVSDARPAHLPRILPALSAKVAEHGWHVQFYAHGSDIVDYADALLALPNDIVLDHFGAIPAEQGVDQPAFKTMLRMLETGRVWVKLSGPLYCSRLEYPYADLQPFARMLVEHAPERLVWGTDWPHLHLHGRAMPNDGALLDLLSDWVPDEKTRHAVLVDNPSRLYGFAGATPHRP
jgi:2-pyrone-4,6-dicarboxylate lactonase